MTHTTYHTRPVAPTTTPAEAIAMALIRGAASDAADAPSYANPGREAVTELRKWADSWATYQDGSVLYVGESACHDGTSETLYLCVEARAAMGPRDRGYLVLDMPRHFDDDGLRILRVAADLALAKA